MSPECRRAKTLMRPIWHFESVVQHSKSEDFWVPILLSSLDAFWTPFFLGFLSRDLHLDTLLIRILKFKLFSG